MIFIGYNDIHRYPLLVVNNLRAGRVGLIAQMGCPHKSVYGMYCYCNEKTIY